jgi:5-formyltetrahydrofolate cyclo-ligase
MNPVSAVNPDKAALRAVAMARRNALAAAERAAASVAIDERVMAIVIAEKPRTLSAYLPIRSECDCRQIIAEAQAMSITVVLPVLTDPVTLVFRRYEPGAPLDDGGFGTLAPLSDQPIVDPDLVIVPLVAFDRSGSRLGHGKGHYDRALAKLAARGVKPKVVGVAFATQEVETIPAEAHDIRLDWIVTENETLTIASQTVRR